MKTGRVRYAAGCAVLAAAVAFGACGGAQEEQPKPQVAKKAKRPRSAIKGENEFADATRAAGNRNWKQAAQLFGQAAQQLLAQAKSGPATGPQPAAQPGQPAPPPPKKREFTAEEKARITSMMHAARVNRGIALERAGDLKTAKKIYAAVLEEDPKNPEAAANLARANIALREYKGAQKVVTAALKHNPENSALLNMLAGVLRQNAKYEEAARTARKVLLRDQKNAAAIKTLALVYADEGKLQLAETFFRNALKLDDKDPNIWVNLGLIAYKHGKHQKAVLEFQQALKLDPKNGAALANIGAISLRYRDYERAVDAYGKALEAGILNCTTTSALGYALEGMQQGQKAVDQLSKAYEMCPKDSELLFAMGMICMDQLRDNGCALKHFQAYSKSKKNLAADHRVYRFIDSIKQMIEMERQGPESLDEAPSEESAAKEGEGPPALKSSEPGSADSTPPQSGVEAASVNQRAAAPMSHGASG